MRKYIASTGANLPRFHYKFCEVENTLSREMLGLKIQPPDWSRRLWRTNTEGPAIFGWRHPSRRRWGLVPLIIRLRAWFKVIAVEGIDRHGRTVSVGDHEGVPAATRPGVLGHDRVQGQQEVLLRQVRPRLPWHGPLPRPDGRAWLHRPDAVHACGRRKSDRHGGGFTLTSRPQRLQPDSPSVSI